MNKIFSRTDFGFSPFFPSAPDPQVIRRSFLLTNPFSEINTVNNSDTAALISVLSFDGRIIPGARTEIYTE